MVLDYINGVFENDEQPVYENTGIDDPIYENTKFSSPTKSENGVVNQALISLEDGKLRVRFQVGKFDCIVQFVAFKSVCFNVLQETRSICRQKY